MSEEKQKKEYKFKCPKCGPVDSITAECWNGSFDKYLYLDDNGHETVEFDNHDYDESDGYYCTECGASVDRDEIVIVDEAGNVMPVAEDD